MKKENPLKAALAQSLETNLTKVPDQEIPEPVTKPKVNSEKRERSKAVEPESESKARYKNYVYSLYPEDQQKIDEIIFFLHKRGERVNASHAVRLALRSVVLSDNLLSLHNEVKSNDGRRK